MNQRKERENGGRGAGIGYDTLRLLTQSNFVVIESRILYSNYLERVGLSLRTKMHTGWSECSQLLRLIET